MQPRLTPSAILAALALTPSSGAQSILPEAVEITSSPAWNLADVGDMDGDGVVDLVLYSRDEAVIKILGGEGGGAYGLPGKVGSPIADIRYLKVLDLDGDGHQDLLFEVLTDPGSSRRFTWARGSSDLEFDLCPALTIPFAPIDPLILGLGPAGSPALVVERRTSGVDIHPWTGSSFESAPIHIPATRAEDTRLLDVNDDGQDDVVFYNPIDQQWRYSSYLGGAQFSTPRSFLPIQVLRARSIQLGDLDGDGDLDLAALADNDDTRYFLFERLAAGGFGPPMVRHASEDLSEYGFELVDIDGDGLLDIQVSISDGGFGSPSTYDLSWIQGLGGFAFGSEQVLGAAPFADLTGDGAPDGFLNTRPPTIRLGGGALPGPWFTGQSPVGTYIPGAIASWAKDVDGDGDLDIIHDGYTSGWFWFENLGGLEFAPVELLPTQITLAPAIAVADFVGDSELDRLVTTSPLGALGIQRGLGGGDFGLAVVISSYLNGTPYPVDIDADGDLDILQKNEFTMGADIYVIENSGIGNQFPRRIQIPWQEGVIDALPMDLDRDGLPDLVTREFFAAGTHYRRNLGAGTFGPRQPLPVPLDPWFWPSVAMDFDGDGDLDLVGTRGSETLWAENQGPYQFAPIKLLADAIGSISFEDIDGNGLLDVITKQPAEYSLQTSPGVTAPFVAMATNVPSPRVQGFADLDGDGDSECWLSTLSGAVFLAENIDTPAAGAPSVECPDGNPNSTGRGGELRAYGSDSVGSTDLRLSAVLLPPDQFGFFVGSQDVGPPVPVPGSAGSICLRGPIGRYTAAGQIQQSSAAGTFSIQLDPGALMTAAGSVAAVASETWYFQAWHRDVDGSGVPTSQFTQALGILFTP